MEIRNEIRKQKPEPYALRISIIFVACTILYYLPAIVGASGGIQTQNALNILHNFYGLDFYALIFFIPVVYAAYSVGVIRAVLVAFASMAVFIPYSLLITNQPGALFRPTAFVLILSAVGAVVAMLQRGDEQRNRSLSELKCLYNIGKAAESSDSIESFLNSTIDIVFQDLSQRHQIGLSITFREKIYSGLTGENISHGINEALVISGEIAGSLEVTYPRSFAWDKKSNHFVKTLAETISGSLHSLELERSLKLYYEQLEIAVENRTRELEQAQQKLVRSERLAAVGELASGVGHELRNPLNVIRNCVYLINMSLEGHTMPEIEDTLKLLDMQVDISNKIVTDLLDFTRVKTPTRSIVSINDMVRDRISWASIPDKVVVRYELAEESPRLFVDAEQVGRAFTNIINNAVQSISGRGEFWISTGIKGDFGWVKFKDTGCGIPPENLNKIFEPLFTTKPKGVGLGLAITKRMVEQNGGEINVESVVGKGTTFTLWLPLVKKEIKEHETADQYTGCR
jgi:signal transduction histidine kinase